MMSSAFPAAIWPAQWSASSCGSALHLARYWSSWALSCVYSGCVAPIGATSSKLSAAVAGIAFLAAVSAPSDLAVEAAGRVSLCAQDERPPYKYVTVEGPVVMEDATDAERLELARRYLHVFGPTTPSAFVQWAGIGPAEAASAFDALKRSLTPVRTPIGEAWILTRDEPGFRAAAGPVAAALRAGRGGFRYAGMIWVRADRPEHVGAVVIHARPFERSTRMVFMVDAMVLGGLRRCEVLGLRLGDGARLDQGGQDRLQAREQDHRRADHDQADEQEQEHGFDGRLGAEEQGQVRQ